MSNLTALSSSLAERLSSRYLGIYRRIGRDTSFALLDQGIVSASRFITTVVIGRICGAAQLGEFSLAFQLSVLLAVAQETLISTPYTIFGNRYEGKERAEYAGSVLVHSGALTILAMACLALAATFLSFGSGRNDFSQIIWILAAITPFIVLREFGRRFAFAHMRMKVAVVLDLVMAIIQIGGLSLLAVTDLLSARTALWTMGLAAAVSSTGWLIYDRRQFSFRLKKVIPAWLNNWTTGRWLFGGSMVGAATDASLYWLLAFMSGLTATGIFAACMAIVQLANPVILGMSNYLEPLTARAFARGGRENVRQIVKNGQLSLAAILAVFCVAVIFVGSDVIGFIFHGAEYANHDHTVIVLGFFVLVTALELSPSFGLRVLEKSNLIFLSKLLETCVIVIVLIVLARAYGMLAAAYALLLGGIAATTMLSLAFFRQVNSTVVPVTET